MITPRPPHTALRVLLLMLALAGAFAGTGLLAGYARGAEPDSNAAGDLGALQRGDLNCRELSARRAEAIGELVMGRMVGSRQPHQAMDNLMTRMMGERGEEQMHRAMGRRVAGCGGRMPAGFGQMMGMMMGAGGTVGGFGAGAPGGFGMMGGGGSGGMMGGAYSGYRSSNASDDDGISAAWMVVPMAVLVLGGLAAVLALARPRRSSQSATPLDLLQRRFAAGEISADEYRRRCELLEKGGLP